MPAPSNETARIGKIQRVLSHFREHPVGFWFVFWGELAERASFYGMRTLLTLYLVDVFRYSDPRSGATAEFFTAACYITPLVGGPIADRLLGKYRTIVWFAIPYIMGHVILGNLVTPWGLYIALALLAGGSGAIKPNTSTLMGLIYEKEGKKELLTEAFSYYYAAINIGAAITSLALPWVRDVVMHHYLAIPGYTAYMARAKGFEYALQVPTVLMAVALGVFALGKRHYPEEHIVKVVKTQEQKEEERGVLIKLSGLFLMIAFFWFAYDQQSSTWITFANSHMDLRLWPFNFKLLPDQIQAFNPVLIVAFTPIFNWMWIELQRRRGGVAVPDTQKMLAGFYLVIGCVAIMAVAGFRSAAGPVSVWYILIATVVVTMAELCVSVVGLEFAFTQATPKTHSTVTAAFLAMVFVGDGLIGTPFIERFYDRISMGWFFLVQVFIMIAVVFVFRLIARSFEERERVRCAEDAALEASMERTWS